MLRILKPSHRATVSVMHPERFRIPSFAGTADGSIVLDPVRPPYIDRRMPLRRSATQRALIGPFMKQLGASRLAATYYGRGSCIASFN